MVGIRNSARATILPKAPSLERITTEFVLFLEIFPASGLVFQLFCII
jgi:hypothetical protein